MSVIDWSAKPEPWRSMGLEFVRRLEFGARAAATRRNQKRLWTSTRISDLIYAREVERKRWKAIAREIGATPVACQQAYKRHLAEQTASE